jgi:hypothetical protein
VTSFAAVRAIELLIAVWALVTSTAWLIRAGEWERGGLLNAWPRPLLTRGSALVSKLGAGGAVLAYQVAGWVLLFGASRWHAAMAFVLLAGHLLHRLRFASSAADWMALVIAIGLAGNAVGARNAGLWFIAVHASLLYTMNGIAKLRDGTWRSGEYLVGVFESPALGNRTLAKAAMRYRSLPLLLAWSTMVFETAFPLSLVHPYAAIGLALIGFAFHLGLAAVMGLYSFPWAFAASYPAVVFCSQALLDHLGLRY